MKFVLNLLNSAGYRGRDPLDTTLNWRLEHGDVALPFGRPLGGLASDTLLGARDDHVERCEGAEATCPHAEDLSPSGSGDADGHFERWFEGK